METYIKQHIWCNNHNVLKPDGIGCSMCADLNKNYPVPIGTNPMNLHETYFPNVKVVK